MKYIRKFTTRRDLADFERILDRYNWYILKEYGSTPPPGFIEVSSGTYRNSYPSLSDITDEILATTDYSVMYYKAGSKYYRRIPNHMFWRVVTWKKDDSTTVNRGNDKYGEEKGIVGYYFPMSILQEGSFRLQDFDNSFDVPIMKGEWHWESLGTTAPSGYTFTTGQDTADDILDVTPAVQDDYPYMKVGSNYYQKVVGTPLS